MALHLPSGLPDTRQRTTRMRRLIPRSHGTSGPTSGRRTSLPTLDGPMNTLILRRWIRRAGGSGRRCGPTPVDTRAALLTTGPPPIGPRCYGPRHHPIGTIERPLPPCRCCIGRHRPLRATAILGMVRPGWERQLLRPLMRRATGTRSTHRCIPHIPPAAGNRQISRHATLEDCLIR